MEITKSFLQVRVAGLEQQLGDLLGRVAHVQGAIEDCRTLERYLETPEPEQESIPSAEDLEKALSDRESPIKIIPLDACAEETEDTVFPGQEA